MINVFTSYFQTGDKARQAELDECLLKNINNGLINKIYLFIDDNSTPPTNNKKIEIVSISQRPTYKQWIEHTEKLNLTGYSILCNSDIYFDSSLKNLHGALNSEGTFLALTRWEFINNNVSTHENPRWSQDTWAIKCGKPINRSLLDNLDFPMGVPRCDNKIAYIFSVYGWTIKNPCYIIKSIHLHQTQLRTYDKKLDDRILGTVAYVRPSENISVASRLELDLWSKCTKAYDKISINKSYERWSNEILNNESTSEDRKEENKVIYEKSGPRQLLEAIANGQRIFYKNVKFSVYLYNKKLYFKNAYELPNSCSLDVSSMDIESEKTKIEINLGLIPPVLQTWIKEISEKPKTEDDLNFWQYPCATEKQAFENHRNIKIGQHVNHGEKLIHTYLPLPWATYIDKKSMPEGLLSEIEKTINEYKELAFSVGYALHVHTACQHIHWERIITAAELLGVTDLHLSHKNSESNRIVRDAEAKITLHGWPLMAVNYVSKSRNKGMQRKPIHEKGLLASFMGAHMGHYRDSKRLELLEAAQGSRREDIFIDLGSEWHFNKVVYQQQIQNKEIELEHSKDHDEKTYKYNLTISDSIFTLCPEGAGPNTLRLWESIAVGSIPVIFNDDLAFFNESRFGKELLQHVIVWKGEISQSLFVYLGSFPKNEIEEKREKLISLYNSIEKHNIFDLVAFSMEQKNNAP